jgi:maleylacetate reductase
MTAARRFTHDTLAQRVVFDCGRVVESVAAEAARLGGPVMLIHGGSGRAVAERLAGVLDVVVRWEDVRQHVPEELAARARAACTRAGAKVVVCVGGGSAIGLGKAIALEQDVQILAVPTTYAGSEATPVWGMTSEGTKVTGADPAVLPATVVYDPTLTTGMPVELTVASGLNGLAHCVEALWAPRADPINLALGLEGARALARGLTAVIGDPQDLGGRADCLYGAYLAAVSFASAGSGLHHKICHVLGGAYDLPHAATHAVVLPHVLAFNAAAVPESAGRLAAALGAPAAAVAADPACAAIDAVEALRTRLSAPRSLAEIGLAEDELSDATARCLAHVPDTNPVPVTQESLSALLRAAWAGTAPTRTRPAPVPTPERRS